jgi:hypothetical protein
LALALALVTLGCSPSVPLACAPLARMPGPVAADDLVDLQAIADSVGREMSLRGREMTRLGVDEAQGIVIVGTTKPSAELCNTLHERFGPLIEVIYQEPIELFG